MSKLDQRIIGKLFDVYPEIKLDTTYMLDGKVYVVREVQCEGLYLEVELYSKRLVGESTPDWLSRVAKPSNWSN